jgi:hypothetical protein
MLSYLAHAADGCVLGHAASQNAIAVGVGRPSVVFAPFFDQCRRQQCQVAEGDRPPVHRPGSVPSFEPETARRPSGVTATATFTFCGSSKQTKQSLCPANQKSRCYFGSSNPPINERNQPCRNKPDTKSLSVDTHLKPSVNQSADPFQILCF